jgi:sulfatase modifying factor 1
MWRLARVAMVAVVAFSGSMSSAVAVETVRVGNPGNIDDTRYATPGFGGVNYAYRIGMYEVTAGQYTDFLNAVAATDAYGLYNTSMWSYPFGCGIERSGIPGSYTYGVASDRVNRPVNFVSWGDAARFVNWMHSGQPSGVQDLTTTEDGAYYLDGATSDTDLIAIVRQPDARWMIPSEDEWYKAAYYDPNLGDGEVAYWDYPTQSNTPPTADTPPGVDLADGSANYVYMNVGDFVDPVYRTTEVGAYNAKPSDSPYGTFDQGGNVDEWTESIIGLFGTHRVGRGGSFSSTSDLRASDQSLALPSSGSIYGGLRVTRIP